jgi:hypothetical protein
MAGAGPPSTTALFLRRKIVDADLRRHDEVDLPIGQCQRNGRGVKLNRGETDLG